jgi:hypothetical protein
MQGEWVRCLGVPIGNDLNEEKWWSQKVLATRDKAKQWVGLFRNSYFGRNLIVQAMYFGRLRYWLYSLNMPKKTRKIVQKDADILWWSREPTLEAITDRLGNAAINDKRIRGWVRKSTASGPRKEGGLRKMDWDTHVDSFLGQWFLRYLHPGEAGWKQIVDHFLLYDSRGGLKYTEGRGIIISKLTPYEKMKIVKDIPKTAGYLRKCLRAFWKFKLQPAHTEKMKT